MKWIYLALSAFALVAAVLLWIADGDNDVPIIQPAEAGVIGDTRGLPGSGKPVLLERVDTDAERGGLLQAALVNGRVIDQASLGIAGARISWTRSCDDAAFRDNRQTTTTDRDGVFRARIGAGRWTVTVLADGYSPQIRTVWDVPRTGELSVSAIQLRPARKLDGTVVDEASDHIAGASILVAHSELVHGALPSEARLSVDLGAATDELGRFSAWLDVGARRLRIRAPGFVEREFPLTIPDGGGPQMFMLRKSVEVAGVVTATAGIDRSVYVVVAVQAGRDGDAPLETSALVRSDGSFSISGLRPQDQVALAAFIGEDRVRCTDVLYVSPGDSGVNLNIKTGGKLRLLAVDATGNPIAEQADVLIQQGAPRRLRELPGVICRAKRDLLELSEIHLDLEGPGYPAYLTAPGFTPAYLGVITWRDEGEIDLGTIVLQPAASVSLQVLCSDTLSPVVGALVYCGVTEEEDKSDSLSGIQQFLRFQAQRTNDQGLVEAQGVSGKTAKVVIEHKDHARWSSNVTFVNGNSARVMLGKKRVLTVMAIDSDGEAMAQQLPFAIRLFGASRWDTKWTDALGEIVLDCLEASTYEVRACYGDILWGEVDGMRFELESLDEDEGGAVIDLTQTEQAVMRLSYPRRVEVSVSVRSGGQGVSGVTVGMVPNVNSAVPAHWKVLECPRSTTDENGIARFENLPEGWYRLVLDSSGHVVRSSKHLVSEATMRIEVELPMGKVRGRVEDSLGRAVQGAEVFLQAEEQRLLPEAMSRDALGRFARIGLDSPRAKMTTDESGMFEFVGVPTTGLCTLRVSGAFIEQTAISYDLAKGTEAVVVARVAGKLSVFPGGDGDLEGTWLVLRRDSASPPFSMRECQRPGPVIFLGVVAGQWELVAFEPATGLERVTPVTIEAGRDVTVTL
jgi:hypothetical protein